MSSAEPPGTEMATGFSERRSDLVVSARESPADGVGALTLSDPSGARLPAWTPGARIDVLLGEGAGAGLGRQYSLCGGAGGQHNGRIAVLRDDAGRGGPRRVHETLPVGATV